jgi:FkbM family methyltransferase
MLQEKFYTLGDKFMSFDHIDFFTKGQSEVESEYGWEACSYWSTFRQGELTSHENCSVKGGYIFVDLGANIGMSSRYAQRMGVKDIYAFEADPEIFKCLEKNKGDNWKIFNYALTDHRGTYEIGLWPSLQEKAIVPAITIADVFKICELDTIDFLKVDIEGSERSLFDTIDDNQLRKIDRLFLEWHYLWGVDHTSNIKMMEGFITRMNQAGFNGWIDPMKIYAQLYFWKI